MGSSPQNAPRLDGHRILAARDSREEAVGRAPLGILRIPSEARRVAGLNFFRRIGRTFAAVQLVRKRTPAAIVPAIQGHQFALARLGGLLRVEKAVDCIGDAVALADPWAGDDAWSIGCRAYSFSRNRLRQAAEGGRYRWLAVLDATHHFVFLIVFLIDGVPVRFFRGDAEEPSKRTLRQHESEAQQLALALGDAGGAEGLMFRLAVETGVGGEVRRVVFLALRGEEGTVECFWPVPLGNDDLSSARRNATATLAPPLARASPRRTS